jgi:hypothetical protein
VRTGGRAVAAHGPGWTAAHLDVLRVGGIVVAVILALVLSSWTALLVLAVLLAAYEVLVTLVAQSFARRSAPQGPGSPPAVAGVT